MRKSALSIIFVSCLMAPFLGMYAFLKVQQYQIRREIKHEMMAGMDRSLLTRIELDHKDLDQLVWEHSREFKYKGHMYDVVEVQHGESSVIYWVWWDHKESELVERLNQLVAKVLGTNPVRNETSSRFISLLKTPAQIAELHIDYNRLWEYLGPMKFIYQITTSLVSYSPPSPPPKA